MARQKKNAEEKAIRQNVSMEPEQHRRLLEVCQILDRPISWVIRDALKEYGEQHCARLRN